MRLVAAAVAGCLAATASAEPPNLNVLEGEAGESELEVTGFFAAHNRDSAPGFQFNSELSHNFTDSFALELQLIGSRERAGSALRADDLELQALIKLIDLPGGGSVGLSAEGVVGLSGGEGESIGGLAYGIIPIAGWTLLLNAGAERSLGENEASFVYAWSFERELGERWSIGIEGGGESALQGGESAEHYAGPAVAWRIGAGDDAPQLVAGYLAGVSRASPDLIKIGFAAGF